MTLSSTQSAGFRAHHGVWFSLRSVLIATTLSAIAWAVVFSGGSGSSSLSGRAIVALAVNGVAFAIGFVYVALALWRESKAHGRMLMRIELTSRPPHWVNWFRWIWVFLCVLAVAWSVRAFSSTSEFDEDGMGLAIGPLCAFLLPLVGIDSAWRCGNDQLNICQHGIEHYAWDDQFVAWSTVDVSISDNHVLQLIPKPPLKDASVKLSRSESARLFEVLSDLGIPYLSDEAQQVNVR